MSGWEFGAVFYFYSDVFSRCSTEAHHEVVEGSCAFGEASDEGVFADEDAAAGVGGGVADVDEDAFEARDVEEAGETPAIRSGPAVTRIGVAGRYDVEGDAVAAGGDGGLSPYLRLARPVDGAGLEGVTKEDVVEVKTADGVVGAHGNALKEDVHDGVGFSCFRGFRRARNPRSTRG